MLKILGTLLPLTALDSQRGTESLFSVGRKFVDWLVKTDQNAWQMLPLYQTRWKSKSIFEYPYSGYGIGLNPLLEGETANVSLGNFREQNADWVEDYGLYLALCDEFGSDDWSTWPDEISKYPRPFRSKEKRVIGVESETYAQKINGNGCRNYGFKS